ncbi:hypothetical protein VTL71DRAFT_6303 [Oculimacula yallundae]|uniref:Proteophosphoglycan ppg4 n=1 Tax=Oculimacula yallundae TaxID=86028 RepID=A0ABR4BXB3_9HELO
MGNEQSVPARGRGGPNKLSKPRTNNNSSANLLNTKSAPPTRRNSTVSVSASPTKSRYSFVPVSVPEDNKKKDEKHKKRRSLFRSKSAQPKRQQQDAESEVEDSSADRRIIGPRRWSRQPRERDSVAFESEDEGVEPALEMRPPLPRKRMSLPQPYRNTNPRLSLVAELPSPRPNQGDLMLRRSRHEEEESVHTAMSRTASETELYMPIRRRSLLQHGVATRTSYAEEVPPSVPVQLRNYCYNPTKPTSSSLAQIAALQRPPEFVAGPRVETPSELDYGHIGAFKLGSLRITNGAASPASSVEPSLRRAATMGLEEDYIMAGDARKGAERSHRHGLNQRSNTISAPSENQKMPWRVRAESPLRKDDMDPEQSPQTPICETQLEWNGMDISPMPAKCVFDPLTLEIPDPSFALFDFSATETLFRSTESPTKSLELANSYQQDIAMSPFSFDNSPPVSPTLQVMSKHMAVEDDLFAPEPLTPALSERFPRSFDSAYEGGPPARSVKGPRELTPKPLAKADSGYSSNVSLRSFKKEPIMGPTGAPPTPPKDRVASSTYSEDWTSRVSSSTYSIVSTSSAMTLRAQRSLPALPVEEQTLQHPLRQCPPEPRKQIKTSEILLVSRKPDLTYPSVPAPHLVVSPRDSKKKSTTPTSRVIQESPSSDISSSFSRWPSKKSKRPQPVQVEPVFTVQAFRSPSENLRIPAPSKEACRKLDQHVDQFPVAAIPNTYSGQLGMRRSSSKETLGTIFSVGSVEVREELSFARLQSSLPAVPTQPTIMEDSPVISVHRGASGKKEAGQQSYNHSLPPLPISERNVPISGLVAKSDFNRRNTYQAPLPALPTSEDRPRRSMPPMPRERSQSRPRTQAEFEPEITSFGGLSSSLGRGPYHAALSSRARERTNSITSQFEAESVDRYARQRSLSQESNSIIIRSRKSYDSIATGNPFIEPESRNERTRGRPPQAHAKFNAMKRQSSPSLLTSYSTGRREPSPANSHVGEQLGGWNLGAEEERRFSTLSSLSKQTKSPPPVSMISQRKVTPTPLGAYNIVPSSRTAPVTVQASSRVAPQPPAQAAPKQDLKTVRGPEWNQPANFWAERRKSAGEALKVQTRKSMEMRRPEPTPELRLRKSMDAYTYRQQLAVQQASTPDLRSRKSMDAQTYRQSMTGNGNIQGKKLNTACKSFDNSQGKGWKGWNVGVGYENIAKIPQAQPSWVDRTVRTKAPYQGQSHAQEYDHTYGNSSHHNKENLQHEYYDQSPSHEQTTYLPETVHQRETSTSEMLVLDRFSGGLDYGYEAGQGLGGSAGMRNTGKMAAGRRKGGPVSEQYGLDFSDVPVIVQRVPVKG